MILTQKATCPFSQLESGKELKDISPPPTLLATRPKLESGKELKVKDVGDVDLGVRICWNPERN